MICRGCNREVPANSQACPYCGTMMVGVNNNLSQNVPNVGTNTQNEKFNIGFAILAWFIPIVGLIVFIVKKDTEPKTAKVSGICALISFILGIISSFFLMSSVIFGIIGDVSDIDVDYDQTVEEEKNDNGNQVVTGDVTSDWKTYQVMVNNQTVTLPVKYNTLASTTGFNLKPSVAQETLKNGYYAPLNMYSNDRLALYIQITNDTGADLLYTDCNVTRISQTKYQVSQGAAVVIFPGGLKAGDAITEDRIIELFGTPDDTYEYSDEGYEKKTYKYLEDPSFTTVNRFQISVVNGVIDELELDNR